MIEEKIKQQVYGKVLNFVSSTPRTRKEVADRIDRYLYKVEASQTEKTGLKDSLIELFEEDNILDDLKYTKDYINNSQLSTKPRSTRKIKEFLYKKGIDSDLIDREIAAISDAFELENARKVLEKYAPRYRKLEDFKFKSKLIELLLRKGYAKDVVYNVVDTYLGVK